MNSYAQLINPNRKFARGFKHSKALRTGAYSTKLYVCVERKFSWKVQLVNKFSPSSLRFLKKKKTTSRVVLFCEVFENAFKRSPERIWFWSGLSAA
jgi:hypothetical protein